MVRPREGWKLRDPRGPGKPYTVRFTSTTKRPVELSTGTSDPHEAAAEAARLYARDLASGGIVRGARVNALLALDELMAMWLADLEKTHDRETVATYTGYSRRFLEHFGSSLDDITRPRMGDYQRVRLTQVLKASVRKERSALNTFLEWCVEQEVLTPDHVPLWPKLPKKATGTRVGHQRETPVDVTIKQVRAFLAALPVESRRRGDKVFAIRARFVVAYETGLRPALLDELAVPKHWKPGDAQIKITSEIDKARYGRTVPISPIAQLALEATVQTLGITEGPIFGVHDYRVAVERARVAAGLPEEFSPYDLRHGRAGHLLDASGDMRGVAFLLGHKLLTTTNKYLRGQEGQARAALEAAGSGDISGIKEAPMLDAAKTSDVTSENDCAKDPNRTGTGVTPLEPESAGFIGDSNGSAEVAKGGSGQEGPSEDSEGQGSGDIPETIPRAAHHLAMLRAEWDAFDRIAVGLEEDES